MYTPQKFSSKVIIKDDYIKRDGTSSLYLYVSVDGNWDRISLNLSWPPANFDKAASKLVPRWNNDQDCTDYQLMINTELNKVNEILKEFRLKQKKLTIAQLVHAYRNFSSRKDFLTYYLNEVNDRTKRKKIEYSTRSSHMSTLNRLREFWAWEQRRGKMPDVQLPFGDLTPKILENFRAWLKSDKNCKPTTRESHMKNIRTYVKLALKEGNIFEDPYKEVKVTPPQTWPNVLTKEQLHNLMDLFDSPNTPENWNLVLRHFLFSCFTGLRISDAKTVSHENIKSDWLVLMPRKTLGKQKTVRIPLHPRAKELICSSLGKLFDTYSEQYTNRLLEKISQAAKVDFKVTTHTARHTFGTLFIELGGDVVTLQQYMGHQDLKTTMKYVHISEKRQMERINVFDKLFIEREAA